MGSSALVARGPAYVAVAVDGSARGLLHALARDGAADRHSPFAIRHSPPWTAAGLATWQRYRLQRYAAELPH